MQDLAPIVLFVYNRPEHTTKTIEALKVNTLAKHSDLFIFSDAAKNPSQLEKVQKVRTVIQNIKGFKSVNIYNAKENKGLAKSVKEGVTEIISQYGKIIVLEDDLITSPVFLEYMNKSLNYYQKNECIWSISGYSPDIKINNSYVKDIYLSPRGCSWGWATWKDRWNLVDWEVNDYKIFKHNFKIRSKFNKGGNDLSFMLSDQIAGRIDSWAIRWVYSQFKESKYTVYPVGSLVRNIGMDLSGTHSPKSDKYSVELKGLLPSLPKQIEVDPTVLAKFKRFYDLNLTGYIGVLSRRIGIYKLLKRMRKNLQKN
jgi:hypothetical protein